MTRVRWISRLLVGWFHWRNRIRTKTHCTLCLENEVVDRTRCRNDLINANGVDFHMFRLERIINRLEPDLQEAIYAVYGGNERVSLHQAAVELCISRRSLVRRLCAADRKIAEKLEEITQK